MDVDALLRTDALWRSLASNPFDFVVLVDRAGVYRYVNHCAPGVTPEDLIGRLSMFDHMAAEHRDGVRRALDHTFATGEATTYQNYVPFLDAWFDSVFCAVRHEGRIDLCAVSSRDITAAKRTEAALRRKERMLEDAERLAGVGSWTWEAATRSAAWSRELYHLTGVAPGTRVNRWVYLDLVHPDDRPQVERALSHALERGLAEPNEHRLRRASDGALRIVQARGEPVLDPDGRFAGFTGTVRDVTEQRRLEADLLHAQKLDAVGRLAGGIAHDFNNVLTAILGQAELASLTVPAGHPLAPRLAEIRAAAERASGLTRKLLAFARRQFIRPEVIDPGPLIAAATKLLEPLLGERIRVVLDLAHDGARVRIDPGQLEQVVINLALNARDAMPEGGALTITTAREAVGADGEGGASRASGLAPGAYVRLVVADTGVGMEEDVRAHAFEPFFTTKDLGAGGSGLGLASCHGIVKQHGGHIAVESAPGRGARFSIWLAEAEADPRAPAALEPAAAPPPSPPPAPGRETVLIVEDEPQVRAVCARSLGQLGYRVIECGSGREALEVARADGAAIDLALCDVVLPDQSGAEVAAALRAARPGLRVLFASGYADEARREALDAEPFLAKPFTMQALAQAVRAALDAPARVTD